MFKGESPQFLIGRLEGQLGSCCDNLPKDPTKDRSGGCGGWECLKHEVEQTEGDVEVEEEQGTVGIFGAMKGTAAAEVYAGRRGVVRKGVKILFRSCGKFETLMSERPAGSEMLVWSLGEQSERVFLSSGMTYLLESGF